MLVDDELVRGIEIDELGYLQVIYMANWKMLLSSSGCF